MRIAVMALAQTLDAQACDLVIPDMARIGGDTGTMRPSASPWRTIAGLKAPRRQSTRPGNLDFDTAIGLQAGDQLRARLAALAVLGLGDRSRLALADGGNLRGSDFP